MQTPDIINALFEGGGAIILWRNIVLLHRHKIVHGVSACTTAFFMLWGYWNLYYYPFLNQWLSFYAGIGITIANTIWVAQMVYYIYFYKKHST
jgi:hypothetical protein